MQQQPRPQQGWGGPVGGRQLVWYGHEEYHPVQAGSIDGTDTRPHDRAIKRAPPRPPPRSLSALCPALLPPLLRFRSPLPTPRSPARFLALSHYNCFQHVLLTCFNRADKPCAAAMDAACTLFVGRMLPTTTEDCLLQRGLELEGVGGRQVLVDFYRQALLPGWLPRRYGGGVGGRKESGQMRFGCRDRPFKAPL
ncbi:unnamed protein product [Closterium sp. NIES-64]|nr:unnamed protein product [Closterium sp. NIES-64]